MTHAYRGTRWLAAALLASACSLAWGQTSVQFGRITAVNLVMHRTDDDDVHAAAAEKAAELSHAEVVKRSFFPITFPLTTGPGTIAASIALGAQIPPKPVLYFAGAIVAAAGAALVSLVLYLIFKNSTKVLAWLGPVGMLVMTRLMAFILLCIGIQIMWTGWAELNGIAP